MNPRLTEVVDAIFDGDLRQQLVSKLKQHPVIHFSEHAKKILSEGFVRGESSLSRLDCTYDQGSIRNHPQPGYNFAFNATSWDSENDCFDYEVAAEGSDRNLTGMCADTALLFNVEGIYTRHHEAFHQVVFWGPSALLKQAILLENAGHFFVDGEAACDENGNEVNCWTAKTASGAMIVESSDMMNLRECVLESILYMNTQNLLSKSAWDDLQIAYELELQERDQSFGGNHAALEGGGLEP